MNACARSILTGSQDGATTRGGWAFNFDVCRAPVRRACSVEGDSSSNGSGAESDVRVVDVQIPPEGDLPGGSPNNLVWIVVQLDPDRSFVLDGEQPRPMHVLPDFLGYIVKPVVFYEIIDPGKD